MLITFKKDENNFNIVQSVANIFSQSVSRYNVSNDLILYYL